MNLILFKQCWTQRKNAVLPASFEALPSSPTPRPQTSTRSSNFDQPVLDSGRRQKRKPALCSQPLSTCSHPALTALHMAGNNKQIALYSGFHVSHGLSLRFENYVHRFNTSCQLAQRDNGVLKFTTRLRFKVRPRMNANPHVSLHLDVQG